MKRIESGAVKLYELRPWDKAEKILPEYSKTQFDDLEKFINEGGQMSPIIINSERLIVDGYNRWRLACRLGIQEVECDVYEYDTEHEMERHAIVLNSKRRHLNSVQVAKAALRLTDLYLEEEVKRNPEIYTPSQPEATHDPIIEDEVEEEVDPTMPQPTVTTPMADEPLTSDEPISISSKPVIARIDPKVLQQVKKKAAKQMRVSNKVLDQISEVAGAKDQVLEEAVEQKRVSLKVAAELAQLEPDQRHDELVRMEAEKNQPDEGNARAMTNACGVCVNRLKSSIKKLVPAALAPEVVEELKASVQAVIAEAEQVIHFLNNPPAPEDEPEASS